MRAKHESEHAHERDEQKAPGRVHGRTMPLARPAVEGFPVEHAYAFVVGRAYDVIAQKAAVVQLLR